MRYCAPIESASPSCGPPANTSTPRYDSRGVLESSSRFFHRLPNQKRLTLGGSGFPQISGSTEYRQSRAKQKYRTRFRYRRDIDSDNLAGVVDVLHNGGDKRKARWFGYVDRAESTSFVKEPVG